MVMDFEKACKKAKETVTKWRTGGDYGLSSHSYGLSAMSLCHKWLDAYAGHKFFLGLLSSFSMTPKERVAIESFARYFGVRSKRFSLPRTEDWREKLSVYFDKLDTMYALACAIVARGEACHSSQFCTARCFRIVNTGGFPISTMQAVQKIVDRAAELIDQYGFGHLCYGDVSVTQTVMRNSNVLAFYMGSDDTLFVRANLKGVEGTALSTIIHEIAHRLDHKFMRKGLMGLGSTASKVMKLYRNYQDAITPDVVGGRSKPYTNDVIEYEGEKWRYEASASKKYFRFSNVEDDKRADALRERIKSLRGANDPTITAEVITIWASTTGA